MAGLLAITKGRFRSNRPPNGERSFGEIICDNQGTVTSENLLRKEPALPEFKFGAREARPSQSVKGTKKYNHVLNFRVLDRFL